MPRLSYRPTLEAGDWLIRFDVGPAYDLHREQLGLYLAVGLSRLTSVAGGGFFGGAPAF